MPKRLDKEELVQKRRNQIIRAAIKEFSTKGFHEAEVERIARLAGVSKGTIYNYFENKQDLFLSVMDWGLNRLIGKAYESIEGIDDPVVKLERTLEVYLEFLRKNKSLFRILYQQRGRFREDMRAKFGKRHSAHFYLLEDILNEGIRKGVFKRFDARSASLALAGGIFHSLLHGFIELKDKKSVARETAQFKELVLYGIVKRDRGKIRKEDRRKT